MKKISRSSPAFVLFAVVLAAAVIVLAVAAWLLSFSAIDCLLQTREAARRMEEEAKQNFSFVMTSYRWEGNELVVNGYFQNTNPESHLFRMELLGVWVRDSQDQEIGCHFMRDELAQDFRIPAESETPYSFRVYPAPYNRKAQYVFSEQGPSLHFFSSFTVGKCIGADCYWCYHHSNAAAAGFF